jgi:hypothetical protein
MPRAKYIKPPGPLPAIEKIKRSAFRFRADQRRALCKFLPARLTELIIPREAAEQDWHQLSANALSESVITIAEFLIEVTEHFVNSHLTAKPLSSERPMNPANVRAAIVRLRTALKPFANGWVDNETARIVPADLDSNLAVREQEIKSMRLAGAKQRELAMLCQHIAVFVRRWANANNVNASEQEMLRFVDAALNFAGVKHPNIKKHRARLVALVIPRDVPPHLEG